MDMNYPTNVQILGTWNALCQEHGWKNIDWSDAEDWQFAMCAEELHSNGFDPNSDWVLGEKVYGYGEFQEGWGFIFPLYIDETNLKVGV